MEYGLLMQMANTEDQLRCIEFHTVFLKPLPLLHDFVQFTATNERHYKVKTIVVLEHVVHMDEERVVHFDHDLLL